MNAEEENVPLDAGFVEPAVAALCPRDARKERG
jgi:hypothetical protein